jgi:hypothetical protein
LLDLGLGFLEGSLGDVGHEDIGALLGKQDRRLEADTTGASQLQETTMTKMTKM